MVILGFHPYNAVAQQANHGYAVVPRGAANPHVPNLSVAKPAIVRSSPQCSPLCQAASQNVPSTPPLVCRELRHPSPPVVLSARQCSPFANGIARQSTPAHHSTMGASPCFGSFSTLKASHCIVTPRMVETTDLLTDGEITDSTCSRVTPQTPSSADDEMVREILAQAEAARVRATRALDACKTSVPLLRARRRDFCESLRRQRSMPGPKTARPAVQERCEVFSPMEDLVAGVDLVAAATKTPKVDTPPMPRIAPAFEEPLSPKCKGFEGFYSMDTIITLKQSSSTPPWPTRLASNKAPVPIVRPQSHALRDIEMELKTIVENLTKPNHCDAGHFDSNTKSGNSSAAPAPSGPMTPQAMESFEKWRASLLSSALK